MQYSLLVAFTLLLLGIIQGDLISTLSYAPNVGMKQPDEKLHVVVPLLTSSYDTECANYCTHRGSVFRYLHEIHAIRVRYDHLQGHRVRSVLREKLHAVSLGKCYKQKD